MQIPVKIPPTTLKLMNFEYGIIPTPATKRSKVRTIGTKRAITIVFTPYFSKKHECTIKMFIFNKPDTFTVFDLVS